MKVYLTRVQLEYSAKITDEELEKLKYYAPGINFYEKGNFNLRDQNHNYGVNEDEDEIVNESTYKAYMSDSRRDVKGLHESFLCDIGSFTKELPDVKVKIIGTQEVDIDLDESTTFKYQIETYQKNLDRMMDSFIKASSDIANNMRVETLNQHCNVHVGGGMLMTVNETMLLEDSCTDELQSQLNSGWRILAVNVQNDCRRPDYVLGRFNPNLSVGGDAQR